MVDGLTLVCPVRGVLKVSGRGADGLTPTEERYRVEAIKYLVDRGYPVQNFLIEPVIKRFGNAGRNSFRADFAVLDVPIDQVGHSVDEVLDHALLLAEIKRDNADAVAAKAYQAKPLLAFAAKDSATAIYWDNVEQRVFWQTTKAGVRTVHEGPIAGLPNFGQQPTAKPLTLDLLKSDASLRDIFARVETVLHSASVGPSKRFGVMLQILLAKLHDENEHVVDPTAALVIQDFRALASSTPASKTAVNQLLDRAVTYYEHHLPEPVGKELTLKDQPFLDIMEILAPHRITAMRHSVIQEFYMYFAKGLYKWDLAQYFTPPTVTDFVVDVLNPQWSEQVRDPACGSADFLTAAYRRGQHYPDYASRIWGADVSSEAVQVAVLNMVLNGDGKSNISNEDSLDSVTTQENNWDVIVCNPPFGIRIVERSTAILKKYELGRATSLNQGAIVGSTAVLAAQETGILFAELCVRLARPGTGRLALVLPNGYLGNRSAKYQLLRAWLLCHARIAAIVALPRFTFKGSGADVSASVVFLERRAAPLAQVADVEEYDIAVQIIDRVGWVTGDKKALPTFVRDADDGTFVLDANADMILDSDFDEVLRSLRGSDAAQHFGWLTTGLAADASTGATQTWTVSSKAIADDTHFTMDAKRLGKKYSDLVRSIAGKGHFRLGDVVKFLPELTYADGSRLTILESDDYDYLELQNAESGTFRTEPLKGWQLPARAKNVAEKGDFFVGSVWGSTRKWILAGDQVDRLLVTNGMRRFRLLPEHEDKRLDIVAALCSEAHQVQMRALARGSDGLAEISEDDLAEVLVPTINDQTTRDALQPYVDQLMAGYTTVEAKVAAMIRAGELPTPDIAKRGSHVMIV